MNCTVQLHTGAKGLETLRETWITLQHHPNSDFEHFMLVCRLRHDVLAPLAVSLWEGGCCRAIVCGRIERAVLCPSLGYLRMPRVRTMGLTIVHEGVLGTVDEAGAETVVTALEGLIARRQAVFISVSMLRECSPLWEALRHRAKRGVGIQQPHWTVHRERTIVQEPGFLLRGMRSKHRAWIRRKDRELIEAFANQVRWQWHVQIGDLSGLCRKMESVARTTYQRGLGVGFNDDEETRQRLALFARREQLRAFLLEVHGEPKAFWVGTVYQGVFHSSATGYASDVRDFEVGTLMFLRMVDELVREGVTRLDFGLGDAQYKERFADRSWREASAQFFGPAWRGRALRAYLGCLGSLDRQARRIAANVGVFDRVKQSWRARLKR